MELLFDQRVLVVGDLMLDRYTETAVTRISPEAPVPVANVRRRWSTPGGAANVARNLACLGSMVTLIGVRAADSDGAQLQKLLEEEGIIVPSLIVKDRPTTVKSRILAQGQQLLRLDEEVQAPLSGDVFDKVWQQLNHGLSWAQVVIISDYGKGLFLQSDREGLASKIIAVSRAQQIPVLVDPKGTNWQIYRGANCITPNTRELALVLGLPEEPFQDLVSAAFALMQSLDVDKLLVTRGAKGMALLRADGRITEIPTVAHEVSDVSGAGDTVIAVLAACISKGFTWEEAARIANTAAGIVVGKVGTSVVHRDELLSALANDKNTLSPALNALRAKLVSQAVLLEKIREWRNHNERVVFTNGCFDLLHPGHVKLIQEASSLGDRLVVALNSDDSVRRLKGAQRPIQSEDARALVVAGMSGVDAVTIFSEDTPEELIQLLSPDVLVKGGDYKLKDVVGADFVLARGGNVHLVDVVDGYSTTGLVSSIKQ